MCFILLFIYFFIKYYFYALIIFNNLLFRPFSHYSNRLEIKTSPSPKKHHQRLSPSGSHYKRLCLSPAELERLLKTRSYPRTLLSNRHGSMRILLHNHHYQMTTNRSGSIYYRCISYGVTNCDARVLDLKGQIYVINGQHNHPEPKLPASSFPCVKTTATGAPPRLLNQISLGKTIEKPTKIDLKSQIAKRLKNLKGFGDIVN